MAVGAVSDHGGGILALHGIEVQFVGRVALRLPELSVARGEVLALVGPNGAGKSTLLHVAALLTVPDAGDIWVAGERVERRSTARLRRRLGVVFQAPLLFDVGVLPNAASGLRFRGVGRREAERRARLWLDRFGVGHLAARSARSLSGGEAQRVALARAFAIEPDLILLDEPFAALDAPTRAALLPELAARLRETETAAIVVTHDQTEALAIGDRLAVMIAGRIAQIDCSAEVAARPADAEVARFLGIANVLPGRVVDRHDEVATVALLPAGPQLAVSVRTSTRLPLGARVDLALHANAVTVLGDDSAPAGWNILPGVVAEVLPLPFARRLVVDVGVRLVVEQPLLPAIDPGALDRIVRVAISPEAPHLMPAGNDDSPSG